MIKERVEQLYNNHFFFSLFIDQLINWCIEDDIDLVYNKLQM